MQIYSRHIFLPDQEVEGYLTIEEGKILGIMKERDGSECYEYPDAYVIPGYIDLHIHGWGTGSFWQEHNANSLYEMKKHLPQVGVTSFLGTSSADSVDALIDSIHGANEVMMNQKEGAELLGIHMEGPFLSVEYKGMQKEENCLYPDVHLMQRFYDEQEDKHLIRLMTVAIELPGAKELLQFLKQHQITCNIGHSSATFDQIKEVKDDVQGVTHMFSGMKGMHHRELGVVGSALYFDDLYCEFAKQTGMTVRHEAFDLVYRLKGSDRIYLTTDCVGYAKVTQPFHHYVRKETFYPQEHTLKIVKDSGESYEIDKNDYDAVKDLELSYEQSVINLAKHSQVTPFDIMKMTALNPAKYIHMEHKKGSLETGMDADINICDKDYHILQTFCKGKAVRL
ncbi:MAG: N-acetylglucosamine-6-phosphate deacetylase [Erysipelotrichaceae bacterium]|nr:N-acetylglucosamine-6-phosphate deacetylase [Erysipelotrichaceae bacterium]